MRTEKKDLARPKDYRYPRRPHRARAARHYTAHRARARSHTVEDEHTTRDVGDAVDARVGARAAGRAASDARGARFGATIARGRGSRGIDAAGRDEEVQRVDV